MTVSHGWVVLSELQAHIGGTFTKSDATYAEWCCRAVNDAIVEWHPEWNVPVRSDIAGAYSSAYSSAYARGRRHKVSGSWKHRLGALKLAASIYNRRGALGADYAQFEGMGGMAIPGVIDAEISALLDINRHHAPLVA